MYRDLDVVFCSDANSERLTARIAYILNYNHGAFVRPYRLMTRLNLLLAGHGAPANCYHSDEEDT